MTTWKDAKKEKPPQGMKVLCMHAGDFYVAQRFRDYWFPIPFHDSKYSRYCIPDLWKEIDFPNNLTGKLLVKVKNIIYDMDSLEKEHTKIFEKMINMVLWSFENKYD